MGFTAKSLYVAAVAGVNCATAAVSIPSSVVVSADYHKAGEVIALPNTVPSCGGPTYSVNVTSDLCRIVVNVSTSATSSVRLDAWLPRDWNGRFLATGTGGEGGCIDYLTMQNGAQLGFAAFGTNAGHDGQTGFDFFLNQPEVIEDFGHRSIHVEAEAGKQLVSQYYGRSATKSYYQGCSTGGRQGFQEAHLYPDDFDGILVGSPGIDWLHIVSSKGIMARRIGWPYLDSPAYVRPEQWTAIVAKQIELLDPLDGITDGIIDDPTSHRFDPEILACGTGVLDSSVCLTPGQVDSVRAAYLPIANTAGRIVYPSFELGSNTDVFSANQVNGSAQLTYTILQDFWRGAVYNDSTWTPTNFNETDMDFAMAINPGGVNAGETDLSVFHARGGKILSFHGRNDPTVTSALSMQYFSGVQAASNFTLDEVHSFYRLFFIPGMHHCSGGPGAWNIGQSYPLDTTKLDPTSNILLALVEWVEQGKAPESIIGAKYENDDIRQTITAQRRHCVYPYRSKWDGKNPSNDSASWECVAPGR
ncbi:tannase and feruloyl esterase [Thozetella sp. PMI_491]|nr:tannase and feruloyl esterase [Thozetella sp. PMI_491]